MQFSFMNVTVCQNLLPLNKKIFTVLTLGHSYSCGIKWYCNHKPEYIPAAETNNFSALKIQKYKLVKFSHMFVQQLQN